MTTQIVDLPSGEAVIERLNQDYLKLHQKLESTEKTDRLVGIYFHWEIKGQNKSGSCLTGTNPSAAKTTYVNVDGEGTLAKELNDSKPSKLVVTILTTTQEQNKALDRYIWTYNVI